MINKYFHIRLFLSAFLVFTAPALLADSFYSSIGLGIPQYFVTVKAAGMGGAGIGVIDRLALNAMNPAANHIYGITTIAANVLYESVDNRNQTSKVNTRYGIPAGFEFFIPARHNVNIIASVRPLVRSKYVLSAMQTVDDVQYTRLVRGSGGLSAASLGAQLLLKPWFFMATLFNFNFGTYKEEWKTDFYETNYMDASDVLSSYLRGLGFEIGLLFRTSRNFSLGLVYKASSRLTAETQVTYGNNYSPQPVKSKLSYPSAFGVGVSLPLAKVLLSADYYTQNWTSAISNEFNNSRYRNYWRLGGGAEYTQSTNPRAPFKQRISLRLGAYFSQLPFYDATNVTVNEKFITLGVGFPFSLNRGRIDLAFEVGRRGHLPENLYEETIVRFSASMTGGELWFQRRKR